MSITYEDIKSSIKIMKKIIEMDKYTILMSENTKRRLTREQLKEIERCAVIETIPGSYLESEEKLIVIPQNPDYLKPLPPEHYE